MQKIFVGLAVTTAVLLLLLTESSALDLELGGGTTFNRHATLHNTRLANLNLISQADSRFPTEWSLGYLFPQDKNPSNRLNNDQPVFWAGVGKRFRWKAVFLGFGVAVINQTNQRTSSHVNFKSQAGFQLGPVVTMLQHLSNAGLHGMNDGEDMLTVSYRFHLSR